MIQKGKIYRRKIDVYGFDDRVEVKSVDKKYIVVQSLDKSTISYILKDSFLEYFEECKDESKLRVV